MSVEQKQNQEDVELKGSRFDDYTKIAFCGELSRIEHKYIITAIAKKTTVDNETERLFIGDKNGHIVRYEKKKGSRERMKISSDWMIKMRGMVLKAVGRFIKPVVFLLVDPTDKFLAAASVDGCIYIFNIEENKLINRIVTQNAKKCPWWWTNTYNPFIGKTAPLFFCQFDKDKGPSKIVIANSGETKQPLDLWDIQTGKCDGELETERWEILELGQEVDKYYVVSNKQHILVCRTREKNRPVAVWELETSNNRLKLKYQRGFDFCPGERLGVFSEDDKKFATCRGEDILIYNIDDKKNDIKSWEPGKKLKSNVISLVETFYDHGKYLISSTPGALHVWEVETGEHLYQISVPTYRYDCFIIDSISANKVFPLKVGNDWAICKPIDNMIYSFSSLHLEETRGIQPKSSDSYCEDLDLLEEGYFFESKEAKLKAKFFRVGKNKARLVIKESKGDSKYDFMCTRDQFPSLLLSPDNNQIALSLTKKNRESPDRYFRIYGKRLGSRLLHYAQGGNMAIVIDRKRKEIIYTLKHYCPISAKIFSSDGKWLITGGVTVRVWNIENGKCLYQYNGKDKWEYVRALALSKDKSWLAVIDDAGSISIFNTQNYKLLCFLPKIIPVKIRAMAFTFEDNKHCLCFYKSSKEGKLTFEIEESEQKDKLYLSLKNCAEELGFWVWFVPKIVKIIVKIIIRVC
jgi:WD40 repeat protein